MLQFVRSLRQGNFKLHVETLDQLVLWFFTLDHNNYARWLPVHIRYMVQLQLKHPEIHIKFQSGHFTVQKSQRKFSLIALDQSHEQENAKVKGDGGAVGLTESDPALRRWMISGPEVARAVQEFRDSFISPKGEENQGHHEQTPSVQKAFMNNVESLVSAFEEMGNPFTEDSRDIVAIDSKCIMSSDVVEAVYSAELLGRVQYDSFVKKATGDMQTPDI